MSGIGFWELIILFLIGLIVLGPERMPRVANQLGSWLGQARRMTRVMKRQLEDELNIEQNASIRPPRISKSPATTPAPATADTQRPADTTPTTEDFTQHRDAGSDATKDQPGSDAGGNAPSQKTT